MTNPPDIDPKGACLCDMWPPAPHCPTHPNRGGPMSDRLTDAELDRLEAMAADPWPWELNDFVDAMLHEVPALLAEV